VKRFFGTEIHGHEFAASAHLHLCNPTARFSLPPASPTCEGMKPHTQSSPLTCQLAISE
jgi:hypothetical protein